MLGGLATALVAPAIGVARSKPPGRIVALDYGLAQTLIALGRPPTALASAHAWDQWVADPPLPPQTINIGLSREVNLELLQQLKPDVILSTPFLEKLRNKLERIAPVVSLPIHATGGPAMPPILAGTQAIADMLNLVDAGEALIKDSLGSIAAARETVKGLKDKPLIVANFLDARHLRVYGRNSLFDDVLARLGLNNAWTGPTNSWGFTTIGAQQLAAVGKLRLVCFEPVPLDAERAIAENPVWQALGLADPQDVLRLPPVLAFGMLPAATRFSELLAGAVRVR